MRALCGRDAAGNDNASRDVEHSPRSACGFRGWFRIRFDREARGRDRRSNRFLILLERRVFHIGALRDPGLFADLAQFDGMKPILMPRAISMISPELRVARLSTAGATGLTEFAAYPGLAHAARPRGVIGPCRSGCLHFVPASQASSLSLDQRLRRRGVPSLSPLPYGEGPRGQENHGFAAEYPT
jgi:hypothetical protein